MVAANIIRIKERKLFIIRKYSNPRYFKNKILSEKYKSNTKPWLVWFFLQNGYIFQWDVELQKNRKKIIFTWWLPNSWQKITSQVITTYFKHAEFLKEKSKGYRGKGATHLFQSSCPTFNRRATKSRTEEQIIQSNGT